MQVLLVNGSPHQHGCTFTALDEVRKTLEEEGIGTQMYWVGTKPIAGCIDCRRCGTLKKCVFNDKVNEFLGMAADFDGFFFGTPVHWAASDGFLTSFLSRAFFVCQNGGVDTFYLKPAAGVVSARRAGTTSTWDQINKYFALILLRSESGCHLGNLIFNDLEALQVESSAHFDHLIFTEWG